METRNGNISAGLGFRAIAFAVAVVTTALITTSTAILFTATGSGFVV